MTRRLVAGFVLTIALLAGTAAYSAYWMRGLVEDPEVFSDAVDEVLERGPVQEELSDRLVVAMKDQLLGADAVAAAESFGVDLDAELSRVADTTTASDEFRAIYRQTLLDLHLEIFSDETAPVILDQLALTATLVAAAEVEAPAIAPFLASGGLIELSAPAEDLPDLRGIDDTLSMTLAQGALVFMIGTGIAFALSPYRPVVMRRIGVWMLAAAAIQIISAIAFPPLLGPMVDGEVPLTEAVLRTVTDRLVAPAVLIVILGAGLLLVAGRWHRHLGNADHSAGANAFLERGENERIDPLTQLGSEGDGHSTSVGGESRRLREARV